MQTSEKLKLHGFNNLTKSLSFNIYDICYAKTANQHQRYIQYIDDEYNAQRLTQILTEVTRIIGAHILNIAHQDYEPEGASVTMLIAENNIVGHLDKSHITVHTYPESNPDNGISTFRADIDVSTCGVISPLKALNYLIHSFDSDIVILDYRIRGFTRDIHGKKHYIDHDINAIQDYLSAASKQQYQIVDVNMYQENIFHTKMMRHDFNLDNYLFDSTTDEFTDIERQEIKQRLQHEMTEIFYGRNIIT